VDEAHKRLVRTLSTRHPELRATTQPLEGPVEAPAATAASGTRCRLQVVTVEAWERARSASDGVCTEGRSHC